MSRISLKKYREQMEADMKANRLKRRRGKFKCKKYKGKFYWYRDSPAEQKKFLMETKANKLRSRIMPEHKQLVHASLRSKKQLTEKQLTYGRILASSKISTGAVGELTVDEAPGWIKRDNTFRFQIKFHGYFIRGKVPVAPCWKFLCGSGNMQEGAQVRTENYKGVDSQSRMFNSTLSPPLHHS